MSLTPKQQTTILRNLGWRVRSSGELRQAVMHFQEGWRLGQALEPDGVVGPRTSAAMVKSEANRRAGRPTASRHFSFDDFACKCGGKYPTCPRIWVKGALIDSLEKLRARYYPDGMTIVSGCRCRQHNAAVGGARASQHMSGAAADLEYAVTSEKVAAMKIFGGIGRSGSNRMVRHVDRRDVTERNLTGGTRTRPTQWNYAS